MTALGTNLVKFDSPEWRKQRDANLLRWFLGDENAVNLFRDFAEVSETWDDLIDKDKPLTDADVSRAFECMLLHLPTNPLYLRYQGWFTCLSVLTVNAFHDANAWQNGTSDQKHSAHYLRKMIIEFACLIAFCVGGFQHMRKVSLEIREFFYHEPYEQWEHANVTH